MDKLREEIRRLVVSQMAKKGLVKEDHWPFPKGSTEIWYMKPTFFSDGGLGYGWLKKQNILPDPSNLSKTHILLGKLSERDPKKIYTMMQGERWSSEGEANTTLRRRGLYHTSMSVGDIIKIGSKVIMVDSVGFKFL